MYRLTLTALALLTLSGCDPEKTEDVVEDGLRGAEMDTGVDTDVGGPGGPGGGPSGPGDTGPGGPGGPGATDDTGCDETTDFDGDGFTVCDDCDDRDADAYPGQLWIEDLDGDGYGNPDTTPIEQCERPEGYSTVFNQDCDDTDADQFPGQLWYLDADEDGYGTADAFLKQCEHPTGYVLAAPLPEQDCDDNVDTTHPGAEELCDGVDNDCDGSLPADEIDGDGDGYSLCEGDPDDTDPSGLGYTAWSIGGTSSSWTASTYFRGNVYTADVDTTLGSFEVYLGLSSACDLEFYVHDESSGRAVLWTDTVTAAAGTGFVSSPAIDLPITAGDSYGLGVGWDCSATYYGDSTSSWSGADAGIGRFDYNYHDNDYGSYSGVPADYYPDGTGTTSLAYEQLIYVTR